MEKTGEVRIHVGSRIAKAYGKEEITEDYRCRYGLNPAFQTEVVSGPLRVGAVDTAGEVRAVELDDRLFFATLFQLE